MVLVTVIKEIVKQWSEMKSLVGGMVRDMEVKHSVLKVGTQLVGAVVMEVVTAHSVRVAQVILALRMPLETVMKFNVKEIGILRQLVLGKNLMSNVVLDQTPIVPVANMFKEFVVLEVIGVKKTVPVIALM